MFLRTERLFLRPAWLEDAPELTRAIAQEPVVRMLATVPWPFTEGHARKWIASAQDRRLPDLLVTLPSAGGTIVGCCGLHEKESGPEVAYWMAPQHWGKGYATEALGGILQLARTLGHSRIVGRHAADNPASGRVLRKAGFRSTGRVGTIHSVGRGAQLETHEYALDLAEGDIPQDVPMPKAA